MCMYVQVHLSKVFWETESELELYFLKLNWNLCTSNTLLVSQNPLLNCTWAGPSDWKCFGTKWKTESELISGFFVPKHFWYESQLHKHMIWPLVCSLSTNTYSTFDVISVIIPHSTYPTKPINYLLPSLILYDFLYETALVFTQWNQ